MRKRSSLVLLASVLVLLVPWVSVGDEKADQEAVRTFKQYVADFMDSYKSDKREQVVSLVGGWAKWSFEPDGLPSIDVKKSDSLISPYIGICEFTLAKHYTALHKSAADANADHRFVGEESTKHKHTYAFQEGRWVPTSRQYYYGVFDKWYNCDECNVDTGEPFGDINGCWEPEVKRHLKPCSQAMQR